jgi:DNA-binding NtrC family response regulator
MTGETGAHPGIPMRQRVLIVEDDVLARKGMADLLTLWGYEVATAGDGAEALDRAGEEPPAVVVSDLVMPGMDGLALLSALRVDHPDAAVIMLTGQGSIESAVQAMKEGAYDYLTKPLDPARLQVLLERALDRAESVREVHRLRRELRHRGAFGRLVAGAPAMQEVTRQIEQVAPTDATVLVLGESGTGKELVARTIHDHSARRRGPFVAVNCAAIPETLLESEIFGHEKGSFTGATGRRPGCFELADGGTLFLDEIAEMSPATQVKFLRVLQDGRFRRVGGQAEIAVDVRVIAATNKSPAKALQDGALREDLYYRIAVFTLALPPLRDRPEDLEELVRVLLEELDERHRRFVRGVDEAALAVLRRYAWPGNVRELRNVLERAVIVCPGELIGVAHLPSPPAATAASAEPPADQAADDVRLAVGTTVDEAERRLILRTLAHTVNNKTRAAEILGISLKTLHNKLNRYNRPP